MAPHGLLIRGGDVVTPQGLQRSIDVRIDDGSITHVGAGLSSSDAHIIEARGLVVAPGFIDIHVHGAGGAMCESGVAAHIETISVTLARFGVTGFLATIATLPPEALRLAVRAVADTANHEGGARILGIHLEGPYLNPQRAGAQSVAAMRPPSIEEFDALYDLSGGLIRLVTVAPEIEGCLPFIRAVRARGVTVAVGHSNATQAEMEMAVAAGVTHVTHLFNAMRPLHHREPGIVGVALADDHLSAELICDGHHVNEAVADIAVRCKPVGRLVLVSDAVGALGCPEGDCELFGIQCVASAGTVRIKGTGQLAGSCMALDGAVRNLHRWRPQLALHDLLHMASWTPATVVGLDHRCGSVEPGKEADLVLLNAEFQVELTLSRGVRIGTTDGEV